MRVLALLFVLLAAGIAGPAWSCALQQVAELPLQTVFGTVPLVTADINGRPAKLVLDTGSNVSVLNSMAADRLGVAWDENDPVEVVGLGGTGRFFTATVQNLALGDDVTQDVQMAVAHGLPPMIDGVLGTDVLAGYQLDLDMPHLRLVLYDAQACPDAAPSWSAPFTRLPVEQQQSGHLVTPVELNGRRLLGLLDTGASKTIVGTAAALDAGVARAALLTGPMNRALSFGGGNLVVSQRRFQTLKVGSDVLDRPALWVGNLPDFAAALIIGGDYLATRRIWLNLGAGQVFVTTNDQP